MGAEQSAELANQLAHQLAGEMGQFILEQSDGPQEPGDDDAVEPEELVEEVNLNGDPPPIMQTVYVPGKHASPPKEDGATVNITLDESVEDRLPQLPHMSVQQMCALGWPLIRSTEKVFRLATPAKYDGGRNEEAIMQYVKATADMYEDNAANSRPYRAMQEIYRAAAAVVRKEGAHIQAMMREPAPTSDRPESNDAFLFTLGVQSATQTNSVEQRHMTLKWIHAHIDANGQDLCRQLSTQSFTLLLELTKKLMADGAEAECTRLMFALLVKIALIRRVIPELLDLCAVLDDAPPAMELPNLTSALERFVRSTTLPQRPEFGQPQGVTSLTTNGTTSFAVVSDKKLIAIASSSGLRLNNFADGTELVCNTDLKNTGLVQVPAAPDVFIASTSGFDSHVVVKQTTLEVIGTYKDIGIGVPLLEEPLGTPRTVAPMLPTGVSTSINVIEQTQTGIRVTTEQEALECLTLAVWVKADTEGILLSTDSASVVISVKDSVLALTQAGESCYAQLPPMMWVFVAVTWQSGNWKLSVNDQDTPVSGVSQVSGAEKVSMREDAYVLACKGHVGSIACFTVASATHAVVKTFRDSNTSDRSCIFHFPMDHGLGPWLLNATTGQVVPFGELNKPRFVWDSYSAPPQKRVEGAVRIPLAVWWNLLGVVVSPDMVAVTFADNSGHECCLRCLASTGVIYDATVATSTTRAHHCYSPRSKQMFYLDGESLRQSSPQTRPSTAWTTNVLLEVGESVAEVRQTVYSGLPLMAATLSVEECSAAALRKSSDVLLAHHKMLKPHNLTCLLGLTATLVNQRRECKGTTEIAVELKRVATELRSEAADDDLAKAISHFTLAVTNASMSPRDRAEALLSFGDKQFDDTLLAFLERASITSIIGSLAHNDDFGRAFKLFETLLDRCCAEVRVPEDSRHVTLQMGWVVTALAGLFPNRFVECFNLLLKRGKAAATDLNDASLSRTFLQSALIPAVLLLSSNGGAADSLREAVDLLDVLPAPKDSVEFSFQQRVHLRIVAGEGPYRATYDCSDVDSVQCVSSTASVSLTSIPRGKEQVSTITLKPRVSSPVAPGTLVFFGDDDTTISLNSMVTIKASDSWCDVLRESLVDVVASSVEMLGKQRDDTLEGIDPVLLHCGLSTERLRVAGFPVPPNAEAWTLPKSLIDGTEEATEVSTKLMSTMKLLATAKSEKCLKSLYAVLLCHGPPNVALDGLKSAWLAEWREILQGEVNSSNRAYLEELCEFLVGELRCIKPAEQDNINAALESLRSLLQQHTPVSTLLAAVTQRTELARRAVQALDVLSQLSMSPNTQVNLRRILRGLSAFLSRGGHYLDSFIGCGPELESTLREKLYSLLRVLSTLILRVDPKVGQMKPHHFVREGSDSGVSMLRYLGLLCHPWDFIDYEFLGDKLGGTGPMATSGFVMTALGDLVKLPYNTRSKTTLLRRSSSFMVGSGAESGVVSTYLGKADMQSLSRLLPNAITLERINVNVSVTPSGVGVERSVSGSMGIKADVPWPLVFEDDMPRLFYAEFEFESATEDLYVLLCTESLVIANHPQLNSDKCFWFEGNSGQTGNGTVRNDYASKFSAGSVVGVGLTCTRDVFFTLNGTYLGVAFTELPFDVEELTCGAFYHSKAASKVNVNFGTSPFLFDPRTRHPSVSFVTGPTWHILSDFASQVQHFLLGRALTLTSLGGSSSASTYIRKSFTQLVGDMSTLPSMIREASEVTSPDVESHVRVEGRVIMEVFQTHISRFISTATRLINTDSAVDTKAMVAVLQDMISIEVLPTAARDALKLLASKLLANTPPTEGLINQLLLIVEEPPEECARVRYCPGWQKVDREAVTLESRTIAHMTQQEDRARASSLVGSPLPSSGIFSFTITLHCENAVQGQSVEGCFVGVANGSVEPSGDTDWMLSNPPKSWVIGSDTSMQPFNVVTAQIKPLNSFGLVYGANEVLTFTVDRSAGTMSVARGEMSLGVLHHNIPLHSELRPIAFLVNPNVHIVLGPGSMDAPISPRDVVRGAAVDVLRQLLAIEEWSPLVVSRVRAMMKEGNISAAALRILDGQRDGRWFDLRHSGGVALVAVESVSGSRCKAAVVGTGHTVDAKVEHLAPQHRHALGLPALSPHAKKELSSIFLSCLSDWVNPQRLLALATTENEARQAIVADEHDGWDAVTLKRRVKVQQQLHDLNYCASEELISTPALADGHVFDASRSHPLMSLPATSMSRVAIAPAQKTAQGPFVGVSQQAIPALGNSEHYARIFCKQPGFPLGGGFYFGLCTEQVSGATRSREIYSFPPKYWAVHDLDEEQWRMPHITQSAIPTVGSTKQVFVSGDIIKMVVRRADRVVQFFRIPHDRRTSCISLGELFVHTLPPKVPLFLFTQIATHDSWVEFLPNTQLSVRNTEQRLSYLPFLPKKTHMCNGCFKPSSAENWYKCNTCNDYDLCKKCFFDNHHCKHGFTHMAPAAFSLHGEEYPEQVSKGLSVYVSKVPLRYVMSEHASISRDHFHCRASARRRHASVVWMLASKVGSTVSLTATFSHLANRKGTSLTGGYIGVGAAAAIEAMSGDDLVVAASTSTVPAVNLRTFKEGGVLYGEPLSIECTVSSGAIRFTCCGVTEERNAAVDPLIGSKKGICVFVSFGEEDDIVDFTDPQPGKLCEVEDVDGGLVCVKDERRRIRWCTPMELRTSLQLNQSLADVKDKTTVWALHPTGKLVRCTIVSQTVDVPTVRAEDGEEFTVRPDCVLVPSSPSLFEPRSTEGSTLQSAYTISRVLCILGKLLETVPPELASRALQLLSTITLADTDEPLLTDIAHYHEQRLEAVVNHIPFFVAAGCLPPSRLKALTKAPTAAQQLLIGECVAVAIGDHSGAMGVVKEVNDDNLVISTESGDAVTAKESTVLPQLAAIGGCTPWWAEPNGLPDNHREVAARRENKSAETTIGGQWKGELSPAGGGSTEVELAITSTGPTFAGTGVIRIAGSAQTTTADVSGTYTRYQRHVQLSIEENAASAGKGLEEMTIKELRSACEAERVDLSTCIDRADMEFRLETALQSKEKRSWKCVCTMNSDGRQLTGTFRSSGQSGSLTLKLTEAVSKAVHMPGEVTSLPDVASPKPGSTNVELGSILQLAASARTYIILLARRLSHRLLPVVQTQLPDVSDLVRTMAGYATDPTVQSLLDVLQDTNEEYHLRLLRRAIDLARSERVSEGEAILCGEILSRAMKKESVLLNDAVYWPTAHALICALHRTPAPCKVRLLRYLYPIAAGRKDRLLVDLFGPFANCVGQNDTTSDVAAACSEILARLTEIHFDEARLPLRALRCLTDVSDALTHRTAFPDVVDTVPAIQPRNIELKGLQLTELSGDILRLGKATTNTGVRMAGLWYYEVQLPSDNWGRFVAGWGTLDHAGNKNQHVGSDAFSWGFDGTHAIFTATSLPYKGVNKLLPSDVLGCFVNLDKKVMGWSINGDMQPALPIPLSDTSEMLFPFVSCARCSGLKIRVAAEDIQYLPDGYKAVGARRAVTVSFAAYDSTKRSSVAPQGVQFYRQLARILPEDESTVLLPATIDRSGWTGDTTLLSDVSDADLKVYARHIVLVEQCLSVCHTNIDFTNDTSDAPLTRGFMTLKQVCRSFVRTGLYALPTVTGQGGRSLQQVSVRWWEVFSRMARTPATALRHSVLSQLYRQIGTLRQHQWRRTPLFYSNLYLNMTSHAAQDLGGPYRQTWSLLCEELTTHHDRCHPHTEFHRNPLFRFVHNMKRTCIVPDEKCSSDQELRLFEFLGKVFAHSAAAKSPLALDISPFVWRYLVDDTLTIADYLSSVDSVLESYFEDDEFFDEEEEVEEIIPGYRAELAAAKAKLGPEDVNESVDEDELRQRHEKERTLRRSVAEQKLLHSMDKQLNAIRSGMVSIIPRSTIRCMSWEDLERHVCGDGNPTLEQMKKAFKCRLNDRLSSYFWTVVEEMSYEQRTKLIYFSSGQKRLPLAKRILVVPVATGGDHMISSATCLPQLQIPQYDSIEQFRSNVLRAIEETSMDLL